MAIKIYRCSRVFSKALEGSSGHAYGIFGSSKLDAGELRGLTEVAQRNLHSALDSDLAVRAVALEEIKCFFTTASKLDSIWEFSFSSKIPLSIPGYQDIQQLFLLLNWKKLHANQKIIVLAHEDRFFSLLQCCVNDVPERVKYSGIGAIGFLRFIRTLLRVGLSRSVPPASVHVLLYTLSFQPPTHGRDVYFGKFSDAIAEVDSVMTVYLSAGRKVKLPVTDNLYPVEAFATLGDVISSYISALRRGRGIKKDSPDNGFSPDYKHLLTYLRREEVYSGEYFYQQFLKHTYPRMLNKIAPDILIYPFENRSWEKWLVASARDAKIEKVVGYQHSSITPRHLAFHLKQGEVQGRFLPTQVVTIGEVTSGWLKESVPELSNVVVEGVSLRRLTEQVPDPVHQGVLVAISSSREEAWRLMQIIYGASQLIDIPFVIRSHPTIPVEDLFATFDWPKHVELSSGKSLVEDMRRSSIVAYSSSTVALEGMLYGRLPVFINIGDIPSGDPIDGNYPFKFNAGNSETLVDAINSLGALELLPLQKSAIALAERYLVFPEDKKIQRMIQGIGI